jgi:hypothetical protein
VNRALQENILESQADSESEVMAAAHFPNHALAECDSKSLALVGIFTANKRTIVRHWRVMTHGTPQTALRNRFPRSSAAHWPFHSGKPSTYQNNGIVGDKILPPRVDVHPYSSAAAAVPRGDALIQEAEERASDTHIRPLSAVTPLINQDIIACDTLYHERSITAIRKVAPSCKG